MQQKDKRQSCTAVLGGGYDEPRPRIRYIPHDEKQNNLGPSKYCSIYDESIAKRRLLDRSQKNPGVRDDGGEFGIDDNFMDPNMDIHSIKGKWRGSTTCEYTISGAAEGNYNDGTYLPDAPFNIALPSAEIDDDSVVIHHKNWRSRKAKPSECPQFPRDLEAYTGERYTMGVYEDGEEFACIDEDWRTDLVPETQPLKAGVRFK